MCARGDVYPILMLFGVEWVALRPIKQLAVYLRKIPRIVYVHFMQMDGGIGIDAVDVGAHHQGLFFMLVIMKQLHHINVTALGLVHIHTRPPTLPPFGIEATIEHRTHKSHQHTLFFHR